MPRNQNQRPSFFEGQYLGAEDLSAAVDYSRDQMARHALGAHSWGIAMGLQLSEKNLAGGQVEVYVLPGYAWDGFGRPISVLAPFKIPTELFKPYVFDSTIDNGPPEGRLIEIWLRYDEVNTQNVRPGFEVCDTQDQRSRVQETFRVEAGARPNHIDRHDRVSIAGTLIDAQDTIQQFDPQTTPVSLFDESVPYQELPESEAKARWLIPLGFVRWKPNPDPNLPGNFVKREPQDLAKNSALRRYIGLVAGSIQAADGILRMRDRTQNYSQVQSDDLVWVEGNLRIEGDAKLFAGKLDFRRADGLEGPADGSNDVPLSIRRTGDGAAGGISLQVIIGKASAGANSLAIGPLDGSNQFQARLTVKDNGDIGIGTTNPTQALTLGSPEGTRLEIARTSATLPWSQSSGTVNAGSFVINQQSQGSSQPGADFALMRDGKKRVALGDKDTYLSSQEGGNLRFYVNYDEPPGKQEVMRITGSGNVGVGTTTPNSRLGIRATGLSEELLSFEDPDGMTKWHINQNLGGNTPGLNFAETDLADGRLFIKAGGNVGVGTTTPATKLHVVGNKNEDPTNVNSHVAVIENTNGGSSASVLALKIGTTTNLGNNYLTFFAGSNAEGAIEGRLLGSGVVFNSSSADFAECLARLDPDENIEAGDIVGVFGGKITKTTGAACHVTVITDRPIVLASAPRKEERHLYGEASFVGQVPVKVRGPVREGDFIVPSALNDGIGIAIPPELMKPDKCVQIVGRAWESSEEEGIKRINTAIGLPSNSPYLALISLLTAQQKQIEVLKVELEKLRQKKEEK